MRLPRGQTVLIAFLWCIATGLAVSIAARIALSLV
jgi:hypothetical protein